VYVYIKINLVWIS